MASRKTVFGIGVPKDPFDPESLPAAGAADQEDRSSPTVVDDEKVAEGLRQLRSWYQADAPPENPSPAKPDAPAPSAAPQGSHARPTAVGHATAPPASVQQQQRPFAQDPMRATMYGHDVHRFDLEAAREAAEVAASPGPAPAPAPSNALVVSPRPDELSRMRTPPPDPTGRSPSGSFQLAQQGQAERLHRPGGVRRSSLDVARPAPRVPLSSRIFFGLGMVALAAAVVIWLQADNLSGPTQAAPSPPPPTNLHPMRPPIPSPPTPAPAASGLSTTPVTQSTVPERSIVPADMRTRAASPTTPAQEKTIVAPRIERTASTSTTRRRTPRVVEIAKPADDSETRAEAATAPTAPTDKSTPAPETTAAPDRARKKTETTAAPETPPRKKTEATAPETPPRRKADPRGEKGRVGTDADETLPPSEDLAP